MDVRAVGHSRDDIGAGVFHREAERLVDHIQHVADEEFGGAVGDAGDVLMRNLKPLVVGVEDLKRELYRCC